MLKGEKLLWWELDKIAVKECELDGDVAKSNAAANMMIYLERPTLDEYKKQNEKETFKLSDDDLELILDSLDDTAGFLIKKATLKWLIEKIVNEDRERREDGNNTRKIDS